MRIRVMGFGKDCAAAQGHADNWSGTENLEE